MFRFFGRGKGANNALTTTLKAAVNRLNTATKNATTALSVNQLVEKMNTKGNNGQSVTNIFKKAIAGQFKIAHNAVLAAAAGRVPQTAAAQTVNWAAANIKNIVGKLPANKYVNLNRNFNKNRGNFGNVVPNSNANKWWKNVNARRSAKRSSTFPVAPKPPGPPLGGAGVGLGPLPPSGLPANVVKSGNRYFKQNATKGGWVVVNANRNFAQSNKNKNVYNKPGGVVISGEGMA